MKLFFAILALCILSLGVYIYADIATQPASVITSTFPEAAEDIPTIEIIRTERGYSPKELVIAKGTRVVWKNESKSFHWPASDLHPTHGEYSEFDPKRPLAPGEEWSFIFNKPGEWGFHDHIRASVVGSIYVEDPDEESFELEEGQVVDESEE